jgi:tRNA:m4X modification enzyme
LTRVVGDLAHTLLKPLLHHHAARYAPGGEGVLARQAAAAWKQQQRERWQREQAATPTPPIVATVASTVEGSNAAGDDLPLVAPWVITGKHLCGAATDFTIRAMLAAATPEPVVNAPAADNQGHVRHWCWWGAALAPCCHHRCSWRAYVGKDIMRQAAIAPAEFEIVAWLTGEASFNGIQCMSQ